MRRLGQGVATCRAGVLLPLRATAVGDEARRAQSRETARARSARLQRPALHPARRSVNAQSMTLRPGQVRPQRHGRSRPPPPALQVLQIQGPQGAAPPVAVRADHRAIGRRETKLRPSLRAAFWAFGKARPGAGRALPRQDPGTVERGTPRDCAKPSHGHKPMRLRLTRHLPASSHPTAPANAALTRKVSRARRSLALSGRKAAIHGLCRHDLGQPTKGTERAERA